MGSDCQTTRLRESDAEALRDRSDRSNAKHRDRPLDACARVVKASVAERVSDRGTLPFHPWLFSLAPVLSVYVTNHEEIPLIEVVRPALVVMFGTALLWLVVRMALRGDVARSAALASLIVLGLASYSGLQDDQSFLHQLAESLMPDPRSIRAMNAAWPLVATVLQGVLMIGVATPILVTRRRYPDFSRATSPLNVAGIALVAIPLYGVLCVLGQVCTGHLSARYALGGNHTSDPAAALAGPAPTAAAPDIYCIVLDAYARQDTLRLYYKFDNSPFISALEKRGFFVNPHSRANYDQTELCLSAALDMSYLADDRNPGTPSGRTRENVGVANSPVSRLLRSHGYGIVAVTCEDWLVRQINPDLNVTSQSSSQGLTSLEWLLVGLTPCSSWTVLHGDQYEAHRHLLDDGWKDAIAVARLQQERKFVYVHILAPHPPFVFGANGENVAPVDVPFSLGDGSHYVGATPQWSYRDGYVGQLQYVNKRTLEAIDAIRAASKTPPIIIVMGDHGSRQFLNWEGIAHTTLPECFSNLAAFLLPDGSAPRQFASDISPVNHFRILLSHLFGADLRFGTDLRRLPDRSYYSTSDMPFQFTDVTDKTKPAAVQPRLVPLFVGGGGGVPHPAPR
jgi:hypothetical protein